MSEPGPDATLVSHWLGWHGMILERSLALMHLLCVWNSSRRVPVQSISARNKHKVMIEHVMSPMVVYSQSSISLWVVPGRHEPWLQPMHAFLYPSVACYPLCTELCTILMEVITTPNLLLREHAVGRGVCRILGAINVSQSLNKRFEDPKIANITFIREGGRNSSIG